MAWTACRILSLKAGGGISRSRGRGRWGSIGGRWRGWRGRRARRRGGRGGKGGEMGRWLIGGFWRGYGLQSGALVEDV